MARNPVWRLLKMPPQILYTLGLGPLYGRLVLLLTTTGRKTGKPRVTPLQYEQIDGTIYIASARGDKADWYRNILAHRTVQVRVKARCFTAQAEPVADPQRIADFLEIRLQRRPRMIGAILRLEGLPWNPDRRQLEAFAAGKVMVVIKEIAN